MLALTVADNLLPGFVDFVDRLDMKPRYASPVCEEWKAKHGHRMFEWDEAIVNLLRDRPVPVEFYFDDEGDYTLAVLCFTSPPMAEKPPPPPIQLGGAPLHLSLPELRGTFKYRARAR